MLSIVLCIQVIKIPFTNNYQIKIIGCCYQFDYGIERAGFHSDCIKRVVMAQFFKDLTYQNEAQNYLTEQKEEINFIFTYLLYYI